MFTLKTDLGRFSDIIFHPNINRLVYVQHKNFDLNGDTRESYFMLFYCRKSSHGSARDECENIPRLKTLKKL